LPTISLAKEAIERTEIKTALTVERISIGRPPFFC